MQLCFLAPGSLMLCFGPENSKENQISIIQSRSRGVNLLRALIGAGSDSDATTNRANRLMWNMAAFWTENQQWCYRKEEYCLEIESILSEQSSMRGKQGVYVLFACSAKWEKKGKFSLWVQFLSVISGSLPLMMMPRWKGGVQTYTLCVCVWLIRKVTHTVTPWKELYSFLFYLP